MDEENFDFGDCLDAEEFPFTVSELRQAASIWLSSQEVIEFVDAFARNIREYWNHRSTWEIPFRPELGRIGIANTQIDWLWPTMSLVSPSCAIRVERWMRVYWQERRSGEIERLKRRATGVAVLPVDGDQFSAASAQRAVLEAHTRTTQQHKLSSEEINAIVRQAEAIVSAEQSRWTTSAAEAASRLRRQV